MKPEDEAVPGGAIDEVPQTEANDDTVEKNLVETNSPSEAELSSAEPRPARDDLASLILMWILILSIAFLVYRRLKKNYGIDLVTYFYSLTS